MKKIVTSLLILSLLLGLVSCSSGQKKDPEKNKGDDLSSLSAGEFYAYGAEKNRALASALYESAVFLGDSEIFRIETARVRSGYDDYAFSRREGDTSLLVFTGNTAYLSQGSGRFSAPATTRAFDAYLEEFVFPLWGLSGDEIEDLSREGKRVTYRSENEKLLALYQDLGEEGFSPNSLSGAASLDDQGLIREEEITLTDGAKTVLIRTSLTKYRSPEIAVSAPENAENYTPLSDIRLPRMIRAGEKGLYGLNEFQATIISSQTLRAGDQSYAENRSVDLYHKTEDGAPWDYLSSQSLRQSAGKPDESRFYQCLARGGSLKEVLFDAETGEKLSENTATGDGIAWRAEFEKVLPEAGAILPVSMEEDVRGYSISFTLDEKAAAEIARRLALSFPESGTGSGGVTVTSAQGTCSLDRESSRMIAVSFSVSGSFSDGGVFTGRYSVTVDETEAVEIPALREAPEGV